MTLDMLIDMLIDLRDHENNGDAQVLAYDPHDHMDAEVSGLVWSDGMVKLQTDAA